MGLGCLPWDSSCPISWLVYSCSFSLRILLFTFGISFIVFCSFCIVFVCRLQLLVVDLWSFGPAPAPVFAYPYAFKRLVVPYGCLECLVAQLYRFCRTYPIPSGFLSRTLPCGSALPWGIPTLTNWVVAL